MEEDDLLNIEFTSSPVDFEAEAAASSWKAKTQYFSLHEKCPSPGPVGAPVGTKSYGPWSGLDVGRGNLDPVGRGNLDPVGRGNLDPVGRGNLDSVGRNNLDNVVRSTLDPVVRGSMDPIVRGNLDPVPRSNLDSMTRTNLDPVARNMDTIGRGNLENVTVGRNSFDSSTRIASNPVRNLDTSNRGFDTGLDAMSRANIDTASRGKSNAVGRNMDQVGRVLEPVRRGNSPVIRSNLEPVGRGNLDPVGRGNLDPVGRGNLDPVVRGANPLEQQSLGWGWLRPPPGFAPPAPPRAYDPFQSLAAIWSRNALDWREGDDPNQAQNRTQNQHQHQ